jgi:hypothetical protein
MQMRLCRVTGKHEMMKPNIKNKRQIRTIKIGLCLKRSWAAGFMFIISLVAISGGMVIPYSVEEFASSNAFVLASGTGFPNTGKEAKKC